MRVKELNSEVYLADEDIIKVGREGIEFLKQRLECAPRGRVRLCAHKESGDLLHEMIIALSNDSYIRPHKHLGKSESFHIIEGSLDVVIFDDAGAICEVIELGELTSGRNFFYRLLAPAFHTLILRSDLVVFHETTNGPFRKGDAVFAPWAPAEADVEGCAIFQRDLLSKVNQLMAEKKK